MRHNIQGVVINDAQFRSLKRIMLESINTNEEHHRRYEIKQLEVRDVMDEPGRLVCVIIESGLSGDEGTMASVIGRRRAQFFVGRRGGIRAAMPHPKVLVEKLEKYPLIYGWGR